MRRERISAKTHRLIASRWPTVGVFDDLTSDPEDLKAAFILESLTNDRFSLLQDRLLLLRDDQIVSGPGATMVMAAFLHADSAGGRFSDSRMGAWYAALDVKTAIEETVYHNDRRLRLSDGGFPCHIQMRELVSSVESDLIDVRGLQASMPDLYHPTDYRQSQAFAAGLRWVETPEIGIVYDSVRNPGGVNVCLFSPAAVVLPVVQGDHYEYRWDSAGRVSVGLLTELPRPGG
jgi:RES domain-containing protein